jgi:uncharacterized membrane protein
MNYDQGAISKSQLGAMVEGQGKRGGIYRTVEAVNSAGVVEKVCDADALEELEARGINPYWSARLFRDSLREQAQQNGVWLDKSYLDDKVLVHDQRMRQTSENDVYKNPDGKTLTKVNNLSYVKGAEKRHNLNAAMDRLAAHNALFPEVAYTIKGFMDNKNGYPSLVMEQPEVDDERMATQEEIGSYLTENGFKLDGVREWSNMHEVWSNGVYELFDARPANVLKGKDGRLYFIDTVAHAVSYFGKASLP